MTTIEKVPFKMNLGTAITMFTVLVSGIGLIYSTVYGIRIDVKELSFKQDEINRDFNEEKSKRIENEKRLREVEKKIFAILEHRYK